MNGQIDFKEWMNKTGYEKQQGNVRGMNIDPGFEDLLMVPITDPKQLTYFTKYRLPLDSPLRNHGISLKDEIGIDAGPFDLNHNSFPSNGIGASF